MGGMIAAEMACLCPERVPKLALVAPAGLWLDEHPVADIFATLPHDLPALMFHDAAKGAALLTGGSDFSDPDALVEFFIGNARRLGTAGKMLFPIPNRRLSDRLYRLRAETLLVWGESDRLIPPVYAARWQELIPKAELVMIPEAGHAAPLEQPEAVAEAIGAFLS
jgi:pimeloyl-ACP methyl ester carboxylesterase